MRHLRLLALAPVFVLAGCATLPQPVEQTTSPSGPNTEYLEKIAHIDRFAINGRIAVLTQTKGFSGGLRWHHHPEGDFLEFYSPLGTQIGSISKDEDGVTLTTSDHHTVQAQDIETLTQTTMGWSLPMQGLPDWVLGRPASSEAQILKQDAAGRIQHMREAGWDIQYPAYMETEEVALPGKITMKSEKLDLKLVIENWQTGEE